MLFVPPPDDTPIDVLVLELDFCPSLARSGRSAFLMGSGLPSETCGAGLEMPDGAEPETVPDHVDPLAE